MPDTYIHHRHIHPPQTHTSTTYTYMHHMHNQTHICTTKNKTYLIGLPSALYERPGQSESSVFESAVFKDFR